MLATGPSSPRRKTPLSSCRPPALKKKDAAPAAAEAEACAITGPFLERLTPTKRAPAEFGDPGSPEERPRTAGSPKSPISSAQMFLGPGAVRRCSTASPSRRSSTNSPKTPSDKIFGGGFNKSVRPSSAANFLRQEPLSPQFLFQRQESGESAFSDCSLSSGSPMGGSLSPKSPKSPTGKYDAFFGFANSQTDRPASAITYRALGPTHPFARDRRPGSSCARLLEPLTTSEWDSGGFPLEDLTDIANECRVDAPRSAQADLSIDELLSRSFVTGTSRPRPYSANMTQSQSCPALGLPSLKSLERKRRPRLPMPSTHLVSDQYENEKEQSKRHNYKPRRRSFSGAQRSVLAAIRMRRNSVG